LHLIFYFHHNWCTRNRFFLWSNSRQLQHFFCFINWFFVFSFNFFEFRFASCQTSVHFAKFVLTNSNWELRCSFVKNFIFSDDLICSFDLNVANLIEISWFRLIFFCDLIFWRKYLLLKSFLWFFISFDYLEHNFHVYVLFAQQRVDEDKFDRDSKLIHFVFVEDLDLFSQFKDFVIKLADWFDAFHEDDQKFFLDHSFESM
jgi:hypothetical protein